MAKTALEKYERILGPNPEATEDVRKLGEQLERAEQEKSRLKLQLQEAEEVSQRSAWVSSLPLGHERSVYRSRGPFQVVGRTGADYEDESVRVEGWRIANVPLGY